MAASNEEPSEERAPDLADLAYDGAEKHPTVEWFLAERWPHQRPQLGIAAGDEMFQYALAEQHQHRGLALLAYLRSGLTATETLEQILNWHFGSLGGVERALDFASGWGRLTRFLAPRLDGRLSVAEISSPALAFQEETFGIETLRSDTDPAGFHCAATFCCVSAFSLFTHLPKKTFARWLERLWQCVRPGGLLVFSTNGDQVLMGDARLDEQGFAFESVSENNSLGLDEYGTTWATPTFVRKAIESCCPGAGTVEFLPRGLWHFQDLWVVSKEPAAKEPESFDVSTPAEGYLDICIHKGPQRIELGGWAIDRQSPATPPRIRVDLEGHHSQAVTADLPRREVAQALGSEYERCGWKVSFETPAGEFFAPHARLAVRAITEAGRQTVLHESALEGADLTRRAAGGLEETRAANLHLRAQAATLEQRIAWMEASRFWKLRNAWFRVRGRTD